VVKPDSQKVKAIKNFSTAKTTTDVKYFLGLGGYYFKFIPQFSKIAKSLNALLKKDNKWQRKQEHTGCFHILQTALTQEPVLHSMSRLY
jgi:enoyl reductase-like protein